VRGWTRDRHDRRAAGGSLVPVLGAMLMVVLVVTVALAACGSSGEGSVPSPSVLPSGSLGVVTQRDADVAMRGLCEVRAVGASDRDQANALFYDRSHQELHVIAAAAEVRDRPAAGRLLQAMQRVEADLRGHRLPATFGADVEALIAASANALAAMGLTAPSCG
jgi:hypothetical protein